MAAEELVRPFDLCGVRLEPTGPPLTLAEVRAFEAAHGVDFPPEYRGLLLQANGATLAPNRVPRDAAPALYGDSWHEQEWNEHEETVAFLALRELDVVAPADPRRLTCEGARARLLAAGLAEDLFPVAWTHYHHGWSGANFLQIGLRGSERGQLFARFDDSEVKPLDIGLPALFAALAEAGRRPPTPGEILTTAAEAGDLDGVRAALAAGAAVIHVDRTGRDPLQAALTAGAHDAFCAVAAAGRLRDALRYAEQAERPDLVLRLCAEAPSLSPKTLQDLTHAAVRLGSFPLLDFLEERGADVLGEALRPDESLASTAARVGNVDMLRHFLSLGAAVNARDPATGRTLLHDAATNHAESARPMVAFLLGLGIPLNAPDLKGHTPLDAAIDAVARVGAEALIEAGADLTAIPAPRGQGQEILVRYLRLAARARAFSR